MHAWIHRAIRQRTATRRHFEKAKGDYLMERLLITLTEPTAAHKALGTVVWPYLKNALLADQKMVIEVRQEQRSLDQNRRLWAMLTDVSNQVIWYGQTLTAEEWKHVFTAAQTKQRVVPGIEGGFVALGQSTSKMTKAEMSELQTLIEAFGAQQGVKFTAQEY
jgi:hypothetical protein